MRLGVEELVRLVLDLERSQASTLLEERLRTVEAENSELRAERIRCRVEVEGATALVAQHQSHAVALGNEFALLHRQIEELSGQHRELRSRVQCYAEQSTLSAEWEVRIRSMEGTLKERLRQCQREVDTLTSRVNGSRFVEDGDRRPFSVSSVV